jgi:excisionase family DNA binding protein
MPRRASKPLIPRRWATREEAAEYSRLSLRTIDDRVAQGLIHCYRVPGGRRCLIDLNELDQLIESGQVPTAIFG